MAEITKIEWCDATFNPWIGCTKVSPGCDHCYAECSTPSRVQKVNWGPGAPRRLTSTANWRKPLQWNKAHAEFFAVHGRRQRVFCASLADVFDSDVDPAWRRDLFDLIELTPNLDWLLLTKRIGNVLRLLPVHDWCMGRDNVWLGATIVNQPEAVRDIPKLLAVPARVRFLSVEPMLGPVSVLDAVKPHCRQCGGGGWVRASDDGGYLVECACERASGLHWVICGGESGRDARPMHPDWARKLRDECASGGVRFLFKQWGEWLPVEPNGAAITGCGVTPVREPAFRFAANHHFTKVGKKAAGRHLDGRTHDEFPRGAV